jgi:hypothetical protein
LFVIQTQSLVNFANSNESNQWEHDSFISNWKCYIWIWTNIEKIPSIHFIQNILNLEQIIDDDNQSITIVPSEKGFQPLGLFHDIHSKEYNFPTLFFGHARPSLTCSYQKII